MRMSVTTSAGGWALAVLLAGAAAFAADRPRLPAGGKPDAAADKSPADKPASDKPKGDAAAPVPGEKAELAGGQIRYLVPAEGWVFAKASKTPTRDAFVAATRDAMMSVDVLPTGTTYAPDMAAGMARQLKQQKAAKGTKFVQEPTVQKDDRFVIRIRERFQSGDKVSDQLHLYRQVGNRVVLVTVNSLAGEDGAKAHHATAEEVSLSAENTSAPPAAKPPAGKKGK
jgi:hypothetical protein